MKTYISIIISVVLFSCFSTKNTKNAQTADTNTNVNIENSSLAMLQSGQLIYESKCNKCHALKDPKSYSEQQWRKIVPRMTKMLNARKIEMDSLSEAKVLNYLIHQVKNSRI